MKQRTMKCTNEDEVQRAVVVHRDYKQTRETAYKNVAHISTLF